MDKLGIPILSSFTYMENNLNKGHDIFVADGKNHKNNSLNGIIYHVPGTIGYKDYINNSWSKTPLITIDQVVLSNIEKYGYAVIVLHPQDFMKVDKNGNITNVVDKKEINDLSYLIDYMKLKNIPITSFSKLVNNNINYKNNH